jgi:hypothetical protein
MAGKAVAGGAVRRAVSDDKWASVERDWFNVKVDHLDIANRLGLTTSALNAEVARRGLPTRKVILANQAADRRQAKARQRTATARKVVPRKAAAAKKKSVKAPADGTASGNSCTDMPKPKTTRKPAPKPIALLRHVCSTIEGELTKLDQQSGDTSQDRERASRSLSQMVNSLEKTIKMQNEVIKDTAKGSSNTEKEELAHADDLRRQIAERLERLQQKRASADGPAGVQ